MGNWADIAEHIGSYRTKEEVETHYLETYINSPDFPLPVRCADCVACVHRRGRQVGRCFTDSPHPVSRTPTSSSSTRRPFKLARNSASRRRRHGLSVSGVTEKSLCNSFYCLIE